MGMLSKLIGNVLLRRTGYKAIVDGKVISGCSECSKNHEVPGIMAMAPGHICSVTVDTYGKNNIILDPFNIPVFCPHRVMEDVPV